MLVYTTRKHPNGKRGGMRCGLFDDWPLCTDPENPHYRADKQPKRKRKPRVSGVSRISLSVFSVSSLRKRSVMRGKLLINHTWRFRDQSGKQNGQLRYANDRQSKQRGEHGQRALTTTKRVCATTSPCLSKCIRLAYGRESEHLKGFVGGDCAWCGEFSSTLPLYGQPWHSDREQTRKLHTMSPPDCEGARRLLAAFSRASQLSPKAQEVCAHLLK